MDVKGHVLLVEDNPALNESNTRALRMLGYEVVGALTLKDAREYLSKSEPDVILLDVMLPDGDGYDFCAEIRNTTRAHILFLTAKAGQEEKLIGITAGGDDYITKPFHPQELMARIGAAMRRRNMDKQPLQTVKKGTLTLDVAALRAFIDGRDLLLQPREFALLYLLAQAENEIIDAESLYIKAWGHPMNADKNALQVAVSNVRKKLEPSGYGIKTVRGKGYAFGKLTGVGAEP